MSKFRQFYFKKVRFIQNYTTLQTKSSKQYSLKIELSYRLLERGKNNFTVLYCALSFSTVNFIIFNIFETKNTLVYY